jgi:hypothetical protein
MLNEMQHQQVASAEVRTQNQSLRAALVSQNAVFIARV